MDRTSLIERRDDAARSATEAESSGQWPRAEQYRTLAWALTGWADALDEIERLRATNTRLNRRAQSAEAALDERAEDWNKRSTDKQRNHYYARANDAEATLAAVREKLDEARPLLRMFEREPNPPLLDRYGQALLLLIAITDTIRALCDGPEGGRHE